ncbi:MAG: class I SAM-dependent methyltransferase [Endomicrobiaceae bacterium]|jgi:2-polyprenyl-3-methyl-5-hydroxy-6-metoxy-1,4-benzoquinol methylase|nr:class I SAM-dependent methyltransferase [Endomicrobiaceae bacterium]MDD3729591.1 class I SAM-dependent methyltransferase [Endomicrobiaceae bacterium]MDD4165684.1 class I SAM-dependent methyltransferase [Endomicrobiaceae bacterium]
MKNIAVVGNSNLFLCPACLVEFLLPQITLDETRKMYNEYYKDFEINNSQISNLKKQTFLQYIRCLKKYKSGGNILDIGTCSGFLLEVAMNEGFNVFGIELSEYAGKIAENKFGSDKIHTGTIQTANFEKTYFDLITICDVLEHVQNPVETLKLACKLLKKDGYIMVVTPDYRSIVSYVVRATRQKYKFEHLYYFNIKTIEIICELAGLKVIDRKAVRKTATVNYILAYLKGYGMVPLNYIFALLNLIPFIKRIDFEMPSGSVMYILKKV